jgi:hypothetical protein
MPTWIHLELEVSIRNPLALGIFEVEKPLHFKSPFKSVSAGEKKPQLKQKPLELMLDKKTSTARYKNH